MKVIWKKNQEEQELIGVEPMDTLFFHKYKILMDFKNGNLVLEVDMGKRHNHKPVYMEFVVEQAESPKQAIKRLRKKIECI